MRLALPEEQWRRNRLAISIAAALIFSGFTFVMPFLPLYVRELGVQGEAEIATWSGLLLTTAPLLAGLLGPFWGRLGDRFGMKIMVERAILAMALHWGLFGFARSTYHLLGLRIMLGMLGGFGSLSMPLLVSTTPREYVSRSIGGLQTVQMVSAAVGPIVGGLLADLIGIRVTCLISSASGLTALVLISLLYREDAATPAAAKGRTGSRRMSFRQAAAYPAFGTMVFVMFLVSFVERSFGPVVPLYVLTLGTGLNNAARTAGMIISLGLFSEAISATVIGSRLRKSQPRGLLLWRLAGGSLVCLPMGLVWATPQLLVLRVALGLLAGGCMVVVYTLGSQVIPAETRATSFSFLASAALLGGAIGPIVAGALTHLNIRAIFFFDSFLFLCLWVLACKTAPRGRGGES